MLLTRSTRIATLTVAITLFVVLASLSSECQAQRRRFVLGQEAGRFLGIGHGAGYHCSNPGQNTDYYNPYSAHNSLLISANEPPRGYSRGYSDFNAESVPHGSYTGQDPKQHSVFESLPGQTVRPSFEPAVDRTQKKRAESAFENDSDFDPGADFDTERGFGSDSDFDSPSTLDDSDDFGDKKMGTDDDGGFDALKENFDNLQDDAGLELPPVPDAFGEGSSRK